MKRVLVLLLTCLVSSSALAQGEGREGEAPAAPRVSSRVDEETSAVILTIEARNGWIVWGDVLLALSRLQGFDDEAIRDLFPRDSFEVTSLSGSLALLGLNLSLSPYIQLSLLPPDEGATGPLLEVRIERALIQAEERRLKKMARESMVRALAAKRERFVISCDKDWKGRPRDRDLVLLVHGLDSSPESLLGIREDIRRLGLPTAVLRYPGDQPIADSAALLSEELRRIAGEQPGRRVSILAFSMGGLVARAAIEDPRLDPGNVHRLIMVATPNQGTRLAVFEMALKAWVHAQGTGGPARLLLAALEDGFGEAGEDLIPGSMFLTRLNSRERNPRVRYTLFLGTGGPLTGLEPVALREALARLSRENRLLRFLGKPAMAWLSDLDEAVRGRGDGAVALTRGRLRGVEDTVVLGFDHLRLLGDPEGPGALELRRGILERLWDGPAWR